MTLDEQLAAIEAGVGSLTLPGGDLLRLSGSDPLGALDRVISQDVRSLSDGAGRLALLLAAKGQFRALMAVFRARDEVLLLAPPEHGADLALALGAYLKFSRVVVERMSCSGGATLLLGSAWPRVAERLGVTPGSLTAGGCASSGETGERLFWLGTTFTGAPGAVVVAESEPVRRHVDETTAAAGAVVLGREAIELDRIRRGFPAWGRELTETVLPPEVGLETLTISYSKGCYIGQETIARLRTYGHPNRALVGVRQIGGPDDAPSPPFGLAAAGEDKVRGQLTSCGCHPALGWVGLALVRRELAAPGTTMSGSGRTFTVTALPLW